MARSRSAAAAAAAPMKSRPRPLGRLGAGAGAGALLYLCFKLFCFWPINADQINSLYAAMDFAGGNWRLHGWTLPSDNFFGLELQLNALIWALTRHAVFTLRFVPAFSWLLLCGAALALAAQAKPRWPPALCFLAAAFCLPAYARQAAFFYAEAPIHVLSTVCLLAAIGLAQNLLKPGHRHRLAAASLYGLISCDAAASDPMFVMLGAVPITLALVMVPAPAGAPRFKLAGLTVFAAIAGRALIALNTASGGFHCAPTGLAFVTFSNLAPAGGLVLESALKLFNCDPFGLPAQQRLQQLFRLPLLCIAGLACYRTARQICGALRHQQPMPGFIDTALCLVILLNILAMWLDQLVVDPLIARFLLPGWSATAVLAARRTAFGARLQIYLALAAVIALGADLQTLRHKPPPEFPPIDASLAACLRASGLARGFGNYWRASEVTLLTHGSITVRAISTYGPNAVGPMNWVSTTAWYRPLPAHTVFFVISEPDDTLLSRRASLAAFGPPQSSLAVGDAIVDVYGRSVPQAACAPVPVPVPPQPSSAGLLAPP